MDKYDDGTLCPYVITRVKRYGNKITIKHTKQGETTMANRPLRKKLYTLTQEELMEQIKRECIAEGIEFNEDDYGNLWSIRFEGKPTFVAHADTVVHSDLDYSRPLVEIEGKFLRPDYVLGADDRAGVNLILNHKHRINWIITKDEEIGCLGVKELAKNNEFINDVKDTTFFIELDRKGSSDLIGNKHGYCNEELSKKILEVLPNYKEATGVYTDIDHLSHFCQGVNLSVGYYNAHTTKEYLVVKEFEAINEMIPKLAEIEIERVTHEKPKRYSGYLRNYGNYSKSYAYYDSYYNHPDTCDFCGQIHPETYEYRGQTICGDCSIGISDEELFETGNTGSNSRMTNSELKGVCCVCNKGVIHGDRYVSIPAWDIIVCEKCIETKRMEWF